MSRINGILLMGILLLGSCREETVHLPRPRMYPRVFYPERAYENFKKDGCSFSFRKAKYNQIEQDSFLFEGKPGSDCWFNIQTPDLNASLHCSYYPIKNQSDLSSLVNDVFTLAGKHNIKANYRKESPISNQYGAKGIFFEMEGPVASPLQFYLTDEKKHFFRASLYFNAKVNPDSTRTVLEFLKQDIDTLITTFQWKK